MQIFVAQEFYASSQLFHVHNTQKTFAKWSRETTKQKVEDKRKINMLELVSHF
jgi:hypothetical protein